MKNYKIVQQDLDRFVVKQKTPDGTWVVLNTAATFELAKTKLNREIEGNHFSEVVLYEVTVH